ncbi:unnamed protein product [Rotaria magnacalcarata]|uniref:Hermes trasposase DNA-binding domain-containing protein n=1 Tax=Rotaria magnacalcarata TaxID=392030 RepID=A0A820QF75_9BILA|nr:unnamed protein product [Rotaria magnacalcarata]
MPIDCYTKKIAAASSDDKRTVNLACSKYCAFDMRSFNSVHGDGFKQICQVLIDIGYKYGLMKTIKPLTDILIPDRTNISRTIKQIANEYRLKMNEILRQELKQVKLIGISTDYWKTSQDDSSEDDEYEIERYAKAKLVISNEESVLQWWKKTLGKLAQDSSFSSPDSPI